MPSRTSLDRAQKELRAFALSFPEAHEDHPWGESAFKVKKKVFLFLSRHDGKLGLSVKLPASAGGALLMPFAEPTGYGLGKSGWVTARFGKTDAIPLDWIRSWIDESYRAIAPVKFVARLGSGEKPGPKTTTKGGSRGARTPRRKASSR